MLENKKILIVGESSFISTCLLDKLSKRNSVNVRNHKEMICDRYDVIINVACPASPGDNGIEILSASSILVKFLLEFCRDKRSMLIQLSSGEADFMRGADHPHRAYSVGKRFAETLCHEYYKKYKVDSRIVRMYNTYGKGMRLDYSRCQSTFINDAINNQCINVQGQALHTRTFTHIDDTVSGIETVIAKGSPDTVYELANPKAVTIADFARFVGMVSRKPVIFSGNDSEPDAIIPDISKLVSLGWEAKIDLEEGLKRTICV